MAFTSGQPSCGSAARRNVPSTVFQVCRALKNTGSHYIDVETLEWQGTDFPGVEMKMLWQDSTTGAFTALFRMEPGARLPLHRHTQVAQTFILEGSLVDEQGECSAGNFVWRSEGSVHEVHSPNGCVSISVFKQPNEFLAGDPRQEDS